jgi:hypothetical protein
MPEAGALRRIRSAGMRRRLVRSTTFETGSLSRTTLPNGCARFDFLLYDALTATMNGKRVVAAAARFR